MGSLNLSVKPLVTILSHMTVGSEHRGWDSGLGSW